MDKLNTRIALSPTGYMHLGTARTAYFNWLAAKSTGGRFILRIDDTDQKRSDDKYVKDIIEGLDWLGLTPDEIVTQSDRLDDYFYAAKTLLDDHRAKELNGAIVLRNPTIVANMWYDQIMGDMTINDTDLDHMKNLVLIKSDRTPSYHFANVIDDIDLSINYVIRGQDHVKNTPKQMAIYNALEIPSFAPKYAHVGLIHKDKKKMSKRDGSFSILYYRDKGYDPDAVLNFLLRMGWGPNVDDKSTSIIDRKRAVEMFLKDGKMKASSANFDQNKLDSFDRKYKSSKYGKYIPLNGD